MLLNVSNFHLASFSIKRGVYQKGRHPIVESVVIQKHFFVALVKT